MQEGILKKHEFSSGDERSRKNSAIESDSDDNIPLKPKSSVSAPPVDKEREAIDIARERNWEAVKRKHEEASKKEQAELAIGILNHFYPGIFTSKNLHHQPISSPLLDLGPQFVLSTSWQQPFAGTPPVRST